MRQPLLAVPTMLLLAAAAPPAPVLQGTYAADCAPYDGSAFRITLRAGNVREVDLSANAPLSEMAGTWRHSGGNARPGSAMIADCHTAPERACRYPESGSFTITGKPGGRISGTFTADFAGSSPLIRRFTARPAPGAERMLCG